MVLTLNLALVAGLAIAGARAHSLAVLAEGGDYLLDAAGVGVGREGAREGISEYLDTKVCGIAL